MTAINNEGCTLESDKNLESLLFSDLLLFCFTLMERKENIIATDDVSYDWHSWRNLASLPGLTSVEYPAK